MAKTTIKPVNVYLNMVVNLTKEKETKEGVEQLATTDGQHTFNVKFESEQEFYDWCETNKEFGARFREMYDKKKKTL